MITSILIDGKIPFVSGMKKLSDFVVGNWFDDFPALSSASPYAGYYFGQYTDNIAANSFNADNPATINGNISNNNGYISVGVNDFLNTNEKATLNLTVGILVRRPPEPSGRWIISDFTGSGAAGLGFALGTGDGGMVTIAAETVDSTFINLKTVAIPDSVGVGDFFAVTATVRQNNIIAAVYDPSTDNYVSATSDLNGTRAAGTLNILIGKKQDNNTSTSKTDILAAVLIDGALTTTEHLEVQRFLMTLQ